MIPDEEPPLSKEEIEMKLGKIDEIEKDLVIIKNDIAALKITSKSYGMEIERIDGVMNTLHNDVKRLQDQK